MIEGYLRPAYQRWCVDPLVRRLQRGSLWTPHYFTLLAVVFGLLTAIALWQQHPYWACVCLWLSGYCDTLDGSLARSHSRSSARGAVLDIIADRLVESLVIIGLYSIAPVTRGPAIIAIFTSNLLCITAFLVVGIFIKNQTGMSFQRKLESSSCAVKVDSSLRWNDMLKTANGCTQYLPEKSFYYSRGWIERPEAFGFYTVMMLFPAIFLLTAGVYVILVLFTACQHLYRFLNDPTFNL